MEESIIINDELHENKFHGKPSFRYMVYRGMLPEYISAYPMHWHSEMEIIYIKSGTGIITVQSNEYIVNSGDIILIQPQFLHSIQQLQDKKMEYYNILFEFTLLETEGSMLYTKYFADIYRHEKLLPVYVINGTELAEKLSPIIQGLIDNRHEKYTTQELMVKSSLYAIMHFLREYCTDSDEIFKGLDKNTEKIKSVLDYIQKNYNKKIEVKDAARLTNYSDVQFSRIFKKVMNITFYQYIIDFRLRTATELLDKTSDSIEQIAEKTGFCSLSHFSNSFKKKYNKSPNEWRLESKNN